MNTEKKIIRCNKTGSQYTHVKHKSGLNILVWKMDGYSTTSALFGTKYGSVNTMFKTDNDTEYTQVPEGIAHFLEHKLFENEDTDVFELYAKTGASANAYTSFDSTCYLFNCSSNWKESLEILLTFVQEPYFTKETVEKEQGIIGQEIRMTNDNPDWVVFFNMLKGMYHNHPVRIDIAGTIESIAQIDAELLYKCYNTFYNLHNMVLVITGNVDEDEVIMLCDKLMKPCENQGLETVFPDEPETVVCDEMRANLPVGVPIFSIGIKNKPLTGRERLKSNIEAGFALGLLSDSGSMLYKRLTEKGLINQTFTNEVFSGDGYSMLIFSGESSDPKAVMQEIISEIEDAKANGLDESRFEPMKKALYGSMLRGMDNVEANASALINSYFHENNIFDTYEILADMTFDDVQKSLLDRFSTENMCISIVTS